MKKALVWPRGDLLGQGDFFKTRKNESSPARLACGVCAVHSSAHGSSLAAQAELWDTLTLGTGKGTVPLWGGGLVLQKVAREEAWCPKKRNATGRAVGAGGAVALAVSCCVSAAEAVPAGPPREGDLSPAAMCHHIQPTGSRAGCYDNRDRSYDPFHFLNINVFHTVYVDSMETKCWARKIA